MIDAFLMGLNWGLTCVGFFGGVFITGAAIVFVVFIIAEMLETWKHRRKKARFHEEQRTKL